jgi:hypothetical protein
VILGIRLQSLQHGLIIEHVSPYPVKIDDTGCPPIGINKWKMIVGTGFPHLREIDSRISPGNGKIIGIAIVSQGVSALISTIEYQAMTVKQTRKINGSSDQELPGLGISKGAFVQQRGKGMRPMREYLLGSLLNLRTPT